MEKPSKGPEEVEIGWGKVRGRSMSHWRSPGDREKTSCSPSLAGFPPLQRVVLRSGGEGHGDPNRPLFDEVHCPEPLGNYRKSAAQLLGQLPGGHK